MKRINIVITEGDPHGIGPEVVAKALKKVGRISNAAFTVIGAGSIKSETGFEYLKEAVRLIKNGEAQGLVTAPISKERARAGGFKWSGHTEFLAHEFGIKKIEMIFVSPSLKVALATRHVSFEDVPKFINKERITECSTASYKMLKENFRIKNPRIAICALNPHAGESGIFGMEEIKEIVPAIKHLNRMFGQHFFGPYPADTVFAKNLCSEFNMVVAMYHDQGLIPFKMMAFDQGVNVTAGLPFVRTSPVHGTAFDIAGKNKASSSSMEAAIRLCCQMSR